MRPTISAPALAPALAVARAVALATAMGAVPALAAGELYRWIEPDGSRTFSPTPPADGTPYTAVDPATLRPLETEANAGEPAPHLASATTPDPARQPRASEPTPTRRETTTPVRAASPPVDSDESERCTELRNRVVSLERRLTVPLTAKEMDETVVRMAGYQRSFESLCL